MRWSDLLYVTALFAVMFWFGSVAMPDLPGREWAWPALFVFGVGSFVLGVWVAERRLFP